MAIDLKSITPDLDLSIFKKLLGDKTHFIYELVQNADDSESTHLGLRLYDNELFVWNDGRPFSQEDVQSICSTGSSDKDLTQIGSFGIGFKSVYNYTDFPEIYSSGVCFRIPYLKKPEPIDMDPRIAEIVDKNTTVTFRLPFKDSLDPEDVTNLENHLCNLEKERSLLFLRHLKTIQWYDEKNGRIGSYLCHRPDKSQNPSQVELRASISSENPLSEIFLIFHKKIQPQGDVVDRIQNQAEDWKEENRIQRSREELQSIEVAFKLKDGKITTLNSCTLFAYLPTEIKTDLQFLIQARYQTTPSRKNILKPSESLWNRWLVQETADFLPEVLEQLKEGGLLEPTFFNVLPLKTNDVPDEFSPITEALQKAMQEQPFVPTQGGEYAKAENVFYPHRDSLRKLVESSWLYPNSSWLHPDIGQSGHAFNVMQEAGVKEIGVSQVLDWLEKQDLTWFESRCEKWLCSLYVYLNTQKSELERMARIKKLPLVRLENGEHVCANEQSVFFPPEADEAREEIKPFLSDLPILRLALLEGEECNDIEAFLKSIGVRVLRRVDMILEGICPQYLESAKPSAEENYLHVRYIFKVWNGVSKSGHSRLKAKISEIPILRAYKGSEKEDSDFVVPCDAYLPKAYTGDADLETYFSVYDGDVWFVDEAYLEDKSDAETWHQFLKIIGAMDTPLVIKRSIPVDYKERNERSIRRTPITRTGKETIEDHFLHGLPVVLNEIGKHRNLKFSQVLWSLLVKSLPLAEQERETFFNRTYKGTYFWKYRSNSYTESDHFDAVFYRQLKSTAWIPDKQGNLHKPSECFAPTSENRELLGNSVFYLPDSFNISTGTATWLAEQLGIRVKIDDKDILKRLRDLSDTDVSVKDVEPLYRFLYDNRPRRRVEPKFGHSYMADAIPSWRQTFKEESLIFIPEPKPHWWLTDEVFWKNERDVFGDDCGYLEAHYGEHLKSFFRHSLEVPECAGTLDYIRGIKDIATIGRAKLSDRKRLEILYRSLWLSLQKDNNWEEDEEWIQMREESCWLGKKGDEWGFFTRQELVLKDHPHIGEIFEGEVPFWTFDDDLSSLASQLEVERCSQAKFKCYPEREEKEDPDWSEKVRNLRLYIYAFLNSPRLYKESDISKELEGGKRAEVLDQLSVCRVQELKVTYKLKGISLPDPNPRQSFLDVTDQKVALWIGLEVDKSEYAELIGDALQDYFGAKELGRFVEDLLTPTKNQDRVLSNWKRKGLDTKFLDEDPKDNEKRQIEDLDEKPLGESNSGDADFAADGSDMRIPTDNETPKTDSEDNESLADKVDESEIHLSRNGDGDSRTDGPEIETPTDSETTDIDESNDDSTSDKSKNHTNSASEITDISSRNTQSLTKTDSGVTQSVKGESESETPTVHEDPETDNKNDDSTENKSETTSYQPRPGGSGTRPRGGKGINTPSRNRGTDHSSGRSDGTEENTHMEETGTSAQARKEVEDAGMKHAHRYEKKEGRTPKDVSSERHRGYDIYSTSPDGKNRCIEVKARDNHAFVALTSNEWSVAKQLKDTYFLYVVLNARTQPELYIIQNPTDKVSPVEDIRYQVPLSEIEEHGKLV